MKNAFLSTLLITGAIFLIGCKKDKKIEEKPVVPEVEVTTKSVNENGFDYRVFYQEEESAQTRRGIIVLAAGDGGTVNDGVLNGQCDALAKKGYVAITTTYRANPGDYTQWYISFNEDMEQVIGNETMAFNIPRNKVVLGGLSRGGNLLQGSVLPGQMGATPPIEGIKGVILECAGGDEWKGSAILFPVLFMSNASDAAVGSNNTASFQTGLQSNNNPGVKDNSHCLIIPGEGHCTNSGEYRNFILQHIDSWF